MRRRVSLAVAFSVCLSAARAFAQVGTGWVPFTPSSVLHLEVHDVIKIFPGDSTDLLVEVAKYTNIGGV